MTNYPVLFEETSKSCTTHAQHFTSVQQFADQAHDLFTDTAPENMLARTPTKCEYYRTDCEFNGYLSGAEQRDQIHRRKCDEKTRARVHAATSDIKCIQNGEQEQEVMDLYHDETGMFLDSNAYFNGDEFNMVSVEYQQQTKPIVYIATSFGASCAWNTSDFQNRGIAVIRAVHALERQGVSVGVIGYSVSSVSDTHISRKNKKPQRTILTIIAKSPEQALDESDLINTLSTPALFRNSGFQNMYYLLSEHSSGLGQPQTVTRKDLKHAGLGDVEIAVLAGESGGDRKHFETVETATAKLTAAINKQTSITI